MDKTFLVSINGNTYCGKCGTLLFNDERDIKKHSKQCEAKINSEAKQLDEIQAYTLEAKNDSLLLTIVQSSGNPDNFRGIVWEPIYTCEFFKNNTYKEQGTQNLKYWSDMLELNMLFDKDANNEDFNLSKEPSFVTINKVFKGVGYIKNVSDFIKRFTTKGFKNKTFDLNKIKKIQVQRLDLNIGKTYNNQHVYFCQLKEVELDKEVLYVCYCLDGLVVDGKINVENKNYFFISHNFIYNPQNFDIYNFVNKNIVYGQFRYNKFCKRYPNVMFKQYVESGGKKFLEFLIAENNNFTMELVGKAGLGYLSNTIKDLKLNNSATNVKDIFGLPIKALRNINSKEICDSLCDTTLDVLKKAYSLQPAIFNDKITPVELKFLIAKLGYKGNSIISCKTNAKDILDYCRYCKDLSDEEYTWFADYSNMCNNAKLWPYKKFPEKNKLKEAHDVIMHYITEKRKADEAHNFEEAVNSSVYFDFLNYPTNKFYDESPFVLLKPRSAQDLVEESYQMRNCVRSYVPAVANRRTYILFLRYKQNKSKSFVTIEINNYKELVQVKGKCNTRPTPEVKEWMINYCKDKGISYSDCYDMQERKYWY